MSAFDSFVVFAEMRTGSNLLEDYLNQIDGVTCYGEAFNPNFIGYPNKSDILGISQQQREDNPDRLLKAVKTADGLGGFRFFMTTIRAFYRLCCRTRAAPRSS